MRLSPTRKLLFSIGLLMALLAAVEVGVRLYGELPKHLSFGATNWIVEEIVILDDPQGHWLADEELLWRQRPNVELNMGWTLGFPEQEVHASFQLNSEGWRSPEIDPPREGVRRVLHLGDSCTFGLGVRNGETYAARLPELLERRGAGAWESINAGVLSYSSYQGRKLLERYGERLRPDVVTVYFGWNDSWLMSPDSENRIMRNNPLGMATRWLYHSVAYRRLRWWLFDQVRPELNRPRVSVQEYGDNLRAMVEQGRREGFELLFVTGPVGPDVETRLPRSYPANRRYMDRLREVAQETGTELIDAARFFSDHDELLFHDAIHPSGRGHQLIAEAMTETIMRQRRGDGAVEDPRPDVVLITADSLRPDRLGHSGYERDTSPTLDRLAARSIVFERAYAHAPWTVPALGSLLTATYPGTHGAGHAMGREVLSPEMVTLAERLADRGYRTGAFVNSVFPLAKLGMDQGFSHFEEGVPDPRAIRAWLDEADGPSFLWVHLLPPHAPYDALEQPFLTEPAAPELRTTLLPPECGGMEDPAVLSVVNALYDANVRRMDDDLATLLDQLQDRPGFDDAVVIFSSDHGEEFFEHGACNHGHSLHEELLRVPLLLRTPWHSPARIRRPVRHVDVMATVLEALGLPATQDVMGHSLLAGSRAPDADPLHRPDDVYAEGMYGPERRSLLREGLKTVCALEEDGHINAQGNDGRYRCWLHDLETDPMESDPRQDHPRLDELSGVLSRYYLDSEARAPENSQVMWTRKEVERLAAMGYVVDPDAAP